MIINGKVTREKTVLISMQSEVSSKSSLYVIAKINDNMPEGMAASIIETLYCKSTRPKKETNNSAINGKKASFIIEVKIIIDLERFIPPRSIEIPNDNIIKGIAPFPK